ncbi:MAG TPA: hypothetical protein VGL60_07590 [Acidimicrobiales bacterium]|jgi:hypothetical protein
MDRREQIERHMRSCEAALELLEKRPVKGWPWMEEYLSWQADLAEDRHRLESE